MIVKEVTVSNVKTMADRSIRITIDLLDGNRNDISEAFKLMSSDTRMYLGSTDEFDSVVEA